MSSSRQDKPHGIAAIPSEWLALCVECQKKLAVLDERTKTLMMLMKILLVSTLALGATAILALLK